MDSMGTWENGASATVQAKNKPWQTADFPSSPVGPFRHQIEQTASWDYFEHNHGSLKLLNNNRIAKQRPW
jgi:hypothetical protein